MEAEEAEMSDPSWLSEQFEHARPYLQSVAYSMLGSISEAEDAVQECWLRLDRSDTAAINDIRRWLTTVVGRICLDMLRSRKARRENYAGVWLPEPLVQEPAEAGPEHQAELTDSISLALLVVLDSLTPPERLAFVLHDVFGVGFDEIAQMMERSPDAARKLASRGRRRVRMAPQPDTDIAVQREVVDAFLRAAREGDFESLLSVLAPECVFRFDVGAGFARPVPPVVGADAVARRVLSTAPRFIAFAKAVLVNGNAGAAFKPAGEPLGVLGFTIVNGRVAALDLILDPAKLTHVDLEP
jgi:RNA polymerase sigma factor (sigma-70 family)